MALAPYRRFQAALAVVLPFEGGYVDLPLDRGGPTDRGVTQATYDRCRMLQGLQRRDVREMTPDELEAIYYLDYWRPPRCEELPPPVGLAVFDCAVHSGVQTAVRLLQEAAETVVDGVFGPITLSRVGLVPAHDLVRRCLGLRYSHWLRIVRAHPEQKVFLQGWVNRLRALKAATDTFT